MKFREVTQKYPVVRGMASYSVIWPVGSLLQQKIAGNKELNYTQALRFSLYGGFFVAPTLYAWLKCASYFWPKSNLRSAITKVIEQTFKIRQIIINFEFIEYSFFNGIIF